MDLAFFGIANIETFILTLARTAGIFTLVPIFGATQVPVQTRVAIAVSIALIFVPMCRTSSIPAVDLMPMALLMAKEAVVGLAIGFVTSLVFAAVQTAGEFIDVQSGFAFAATLDPVYGSQTAIAGRVQYLLAGLLMFVTNAHHVLIGALADSFRIIPVTQFSLNPGVAGQALSLFSMLFVIGIRIAAPVLAAVFLADIALAIISRGVPQMNVLMVGMPLKLGVGIISMVIALPITIALTRTTLGGIGSQTIDMLRVLAIH